LEDDRAVVLGAIAAPLLAWFRENARKLPWRSEKPDPYHVWISEIMLQQTRAEAVKPYYARFLRALPDPAALAAVKEDDLLKLWEGLGYYSRARNLKRAAVEIVARFDGKLPGDYDALLSLPGIGEYTAGAVASIAFGIPVPAVDGNVLRVLARLRNDASDIALPATKREVQAVLQSVMPKDRPGVFNQALMELGATVCLPNGKPKCGECPLRDLCAGYRAGTVEKLPVKAKKAPRRIERLTVFVLQSEGNVAVRKRPESGLLAGLWELPHEEGWLDAAGMAKWLGEQGMEPAGAIAERSAKHIFTHIEWHIRVYDLPVRCKALPTGWEWSDGGHALPSAFRICLNEEL